MKKFFEPAAKVILKINLLVTGVATFFINFEVSTVFGDYQILQVFGVLNIIFAVGWDFTSHYVKPVKKNTKKEQ